MQLPEKLSRKALKRCFDNIGEATWDYYFDYERKNGLRDCRVTVSGVIVYYSTEKIKTWLVMQGHFTPAEFEATSRPSNGWGAMQIRTHQLAS